MTDMGRSRLRTSALLRKIRGAGNVEELLEHHDDTFDMPALHVYLNQLCVRLGKVPEQVILRSTIHRTYGHQIFNGTRRPSRDKVLQLAFGLELDIEETQTLLRMARMAALYPRIKRDAAILFALENHMDMLDVQGLLNRLDCTLLGGAEKDG